MKLAQIQEALEICERFQKQARATMTEHRARHYRWHSETTPISDHVDTCPKHQGALKRASLDLTRALSDLRRTTP